MPFNPVQPMLSPNFYIATNYQPDAVPGKRFCLQFLGHID